MVSKPILLYSFTISLCLCITLAACAIDGQIPVDNDASEVTIKLSGACNLHTVREHREYLPEYKVRPIYPTEALVHGIEGYVIVELTVTRTGTTRDVKIVEAKPADVFNRSGIETAQKFLYKPVLCNGEPFEVYGVQNKITFNIED